MRANKGGHGMHWFGLTELEWLAIVIVIVGTIAIDRLNRIGVLLNGIHKIMWEQTGGDSRH